MVGGLKLLEAQIWLAMEHVRDQGEGALGKIDALPSPTFLKTLSPLDNWAQASQATLAEQGSGFSG